jgi:MOSC domain-containing protein YiiM
MGQEILVGETVRLRVTQGAERCVMIGFAQEELGAEPSLLRRVGEEHGTCLGVYVNVIVPGVITPNDPVRLG